MRNLSRRWGTGIAVGLVVSSLGVGTTWSYLRTVHSELGQVIRDAVPISAELKRLDHDSQNLLPEIHANQRVAAQLDAEIETNDREVSELKNAQEVALAEMKKLRADLEQPDGSIEYGGRKYSRTEISADLDHRLKKYDELNEQLSSKQRLLETRRKTLATATANIREYQQQRDLLRDKVASLNAELSLIESSKAIGSVEIDNSKLRDAKQLAQEIETRIRTEQKFVERQRDESGKIPVSADVRPAAQRFDERFADATKP